VAHRALALPLPALLTGVLTIDGQSIILGDRIIVKNEAAGANNGLYICTVAGAVGVAYVLTRTTDADTSAELNGAFCFVEDGTVNDSTGWVIANNSAITIGTTAITWTQFSGAGTYLAGTGLTLTGNSFSVNASQTQITALGTIGTGVWQATKIGLAYGGTNADLSATGGTSRVLMQTSTGAAITVARLAASDLSNGTQGSGQVVLATSLTLTTPNMQAWQRQHP